MTTYRDFASAHTNWGSGIPSAPEFTWFYLPGSDLKSSLTYPNGMTASWSYGNRGELLEMNNASPTGTISRYTYTYDAAGRRIGCDKSGSAFTSPDTNSYLYNTRSELTNATATVDSAYRYGYAFDDIGNRRSSAECGVQSAEYTANNLNQYTNIVYSAVSPATCHLSPTYDADGNQTLVRTATGIWQITYNGENRPILWTCLESNNPNNSNNQTIVSMSYDRMGRRVTKNDQRFVYNGYLQIANHHSSTSTSYFNYYLWDPTEPVATRPLAWTTPTTNHESPITRFYTHDGNKNVSEVIASNNDVSAHYEYAPFGAVIICRDGTSQPSNLPTPQLALANPWRFSSEYAEDDTATVYYNYRHYEPVMGRWLRRDQIGEMVSMNVYCWCENNSACKYDKLGLEGWTFSATKYDKEASDYCPGMRVIVTYEMNSDEKKCCDAVVVYRYVRMKGGNGGLEGDYVLDGTADQSVVDMTNPSIGSAPEDNPEGPGGFWMIILYRREWRWDFKFEAKCAKGYNKDKVLSTAQKFYYAEGHWDGNDFEGHFYDK